MKQLYWNVNAFFIFCNNIEAINDNIKTFIAIPVNFIMIWLSYFDLSKNPREAIKLYKKSSLLKPI